MTYISVDWALIKISIILFSFIFILIGAYPLVIDYNLLELPKINDFILHIVLIAMGTIQLVLLGVKSSRPKID